MGIDPGRFVTLEAAGALAVGGGRFAMRLRLTRGLLDPRFGGLRIGLAPGGGVGLCAPGPGTGTPFGALLLIVLVSAVGDGSVDEGGRR